MIMINENKEGFKGILYLLIKNYINNNNDFSIVKNSNNNDNSIVFKSKNKSRFYNNNSNINYKYLNNSKNISNNNNYKKIIDNILTKYPLQSNSLINNINKENYEYNFCLKLYNKTNDIEVLKLIEKIY